MKKLLTLVVILLFASTFFAQEAKSANAAEFEEFAQQMSQEVKSGDVKVRTMNHLLFNKKKELGKLSDEIQRPHGPQNNDVTIYTQNFENLPGIWTQSLRPNFGVADTTTFNAFKGEGGEYSWWLGSNDPSYLQPGYGHNWRVALETVQSFQIQSNLATAVLEFDAFYNLEEGWDGVHLQVASAATSAGPFTNWAYVACYSGDTGGQWLQNVQVNISSYISSPAKWLKFRFVLVSDASYDSQDGEVGGFDNPGGFFFDNLKLRRNNVPELVSDGGDNKYEFLPFSVIPAVNDFFLTGTRYNSADTSMGHKNYQPGEYRLFTVDDPAADLTVPALGGNDVAPLWMDFKVWSNIPYDANATGGAYTYWRPIGYFWGSPTRPAGYYSLTPSVYVGPMRDGDNFVSFSDMFGYINLTPFIGGYLELGIIYYSNGGCDFDLGQLYVDDFKIIQKNDPYEWNDYCDTATIASYGFVTSFANLWDEFDVDYYYFTGEAGDWVDIYVDNSFVDAQVSLVPQVGPFNSVIDNSSCGLIMESVGASCCPLYSFHDGYFYDRVIWNLPVTGGYFVEVMGVGGDTGGYVLYIDKLTSAAAISSITDIPNDQGKRVKVQFTAPGLDVLNDADFDYWGAGVNFYQIERRKSPISSDWEFAGELNAIGKAGQSYIVEASTVFDSANTSFRVATVGGNVDRQGRFVTFSATGIGQSYDNIAPTFINEYTLAPLSGTGVDVAAEVDYGGGTNGVSDIKFYNIYRSDVSGFTPSAGNLLATLETSNLKIRYNDATYDGSPEFYYVIQVVDDGGNKVFSKEVNTVTSVENEAVPTVYSLSQNYPNPFNPATTIKFGIPQAADVTIKIYDILGQEVKALVNRNLAPGFHTVNFDASNLISGMYIYRIQANGVDGSNFTDVKKMLLVK